MADSEAPWTQELMVYLDRHVPRATAPATARAAGARGAMAEAGRPGMIAARPGVLRTELSAAVRAPVASPVVSPIARASVALEPVARAPATAQVIPGKRRLLAPWVLQAALPHIIRDPVPAAEPPVRAGEYLLWVDRPSTTVLVALATPRRTGFSFTLRQDPDARITGASCVLGVGAYPAEELAQLGARRQAWTEALVRAGYPSASWRFEPLSLQRLEGALVLPEGHAARPPEVLMSASQGEASFLVELSPLGAQVWRQALAEARGDTIPGLCRLRASYYARRPDRIEAQAQELVAPLGALLGDLGREAITTVDPQRSVEAHVLVVGHQTLESVVIDWRPNLGHQPESLVFNESGGQFTAQLAAQDLGAIEIDWTATVRFKPAGWPVITRSGKSRFAEGSWSIVLKPDSWITEYDILVLLLDRQGNTVTSDAGDLTQRVQGQLTFSAPGVNNGTPLRTTFETRSLEEVTIAVPATANEPDARLELSLFALRGGQSGLATRLLRPTETLVAIKVFPDAHIEIATQEDRVAERSPESEALTVLAGLR